MKRICYIFTGGRKQRLEQARRGETPFEFLYGFYHLKEKGYHVDILEIDDLGFDKESKKYQKLFNKNQLITRLTQLVSSSHFFYNSLEKLNTYDIIIGCNDYIALGLAYYKKRKLLKPELAFFVMGMLAKIPFYYKPFSLQYQLGLKIYRDLVKSCSAVLFLGAGEYNFGLQHFKKYANRFHFLPFGIDTDFWTPGAEDDDSGTYILAIGNDSNRDYEFLLQLMKHMPEYNFKIVTQSPVLHENNLPGNAQKITGDWKKSLLTDKAIREYYRKSSMVLVPLKETLQPSGQSVSLQAMACKKPVIITKTGGFWDNDNFIDRKNILFAASNSINSWKECIHALKDADFSENLAESGRRLVHTQYSLTLFSEKLEMILGN